MPGQFQFIILFRRSPEELTGEEKHLLQTSFGIEPILFKTDPGSGQAHLTDCERLKPVAVISFGEEKEKAVLALAIDAKYQHYKIVPGKEGGLPAELVPLGTGPTSNASQ
ncbi:MAG: hypothetical protein KGH56_03820 [Patescibacteria group bacterium]|nr:hypothetical protein [Patescibacteria group bacterium]